jgi:hypothetical protein
MLNQSLMHLFNFPKLNEMHMLVNYFSHVCITTIIDTKGAMILHALQDFLSISTKGAMFMHALQVSNFLWWGKWYNN